MALFIVAVVILAIVMYLAGGVVLTWITKIFKIEGANFKKSLVTLLFSGVVAFISSIIFGVLNLKIISNILVTVATFGAFHFLFKKYYQTNWKKSLGIYATYSVITFVLALSIVIPVRMYVVQPFFVQGDSMSPAFNNNDYLLINRLTKSYQRNDVVIARAPQKDGFIIKRVIGLPGEKIELSDGQILINGEILKNSNIANLGKFNTVVNLGSDEYYILGDNAPKSFDSRAFGPIKKADIIGEVFYRVKF